MPENQQNRVTVEALDIPFLRLVAFFVKAGLAAVPAVIILMVIFMLFGAMLHGLFGAGYWGMHSWRY